MVLSVTAATNMKTMIHVVKIQCMTNQGTTLYISCPFSSIMNNPTGGFLYALLFTPSVQVYDLAVVNVLPESRDRDFGVEALSSVLYC